MPNNETVILIPAYNPDERLIYLVESLKSKGNNIVVVDDGSKDKKIFQEISTYCEVIKNDINLGKGQALKKGFRYILENYSNSIGVITADADGQHSLEDIQKIKDEVMKKQDNLVLGSRNFDGKNVPLRNKIGNKTINFLFKTKTGLKLKDTQTGLRGIPTSKLEKIISIPGDKYEYEMNTLEYFAKNTPIKEIPIQTIYLKDIKSKFNPVADSAKIIKNFMATAKNDNL